MKDRYTEGALARSSPLFQRIAGGENAASFPSVRAFKDHYLDDYVPHDAQKRLAQAMASKRWVGVVAGRRSGKTYGGGREFIKRIVRDFHAQRGAGGRWSPPAVLTDDAKPFLWYWCVAPTYALGTYQKREIFEILGGIGSPLVLKYHRSKNQLWLRGGILIEFKTADNPERLVGSGLDGAWLDEAARIKDSTWDDNLRPALSDKMGWALFTTTPLGKNWVYEQIWTVKREEYAQIKFTTADNTALPHLVREVEEARETLSRAVFLRNYMASFDAFEGKIYEDFLDDRTHVVSELPRGKIYRKFGGVDWGHSNPGTALSVGVSVGGYLYVCEESYASKVPTVPPPRKPSVDSWSNRLKAQEKRGCAHWWADPSEPDNIVLMRQNNLDVRRANNSVNPGIDLVATLLKPVTRPGGSKRPTLYIHESCKNLREELSGYRWGDNGKPVKENDHTCDALRYALYTEAKRGRLFQVDGIQDRLGFDAFDMAA